MKTGRPLKDKTGQKNGHLTVLHRGESKGRDTIWICICDCPNQTVVEVRAGNLKRTVSCGCEGRRSRSDRRTRDLKGITFTALKVEKRNGSTPAGKARWDVECVPCGSSKTVTSGALLSGNTRSCGCAKSFLQTDLFFFVSSISECDVIQHDRTQIAPLELDIWIPDKRLAIEFDGLYWHGEKQSLAAGKHKLASFYKFKECESAGIRLLTIFEDEWVSNRDAVKGYLASIFGQKTSIGARECSVVPNEGRSFISEHHLQGAPPGVTYSLSFNSKTVAAASFTKVGSSKRMELPEETWELNRYCVSPELAIAGGVSRLIHAFLRQTSCRAVISYSDNRWSVGAMYKAAGFVKDRVGLPTYWYFRPGDQTRRIHRFNWRRDVALATYGGSTEDTEWDIMSRNGWDRIWDCGKTRWVYYPR